MDKLKLAHEWAMNTINAGYCNETKLMVKEAWQYADAMQAEADKRNKAEAEQKRKEIREMLNAPNTFIEREGQHFDDVEGCEVDWRVAPEWAAEWNMSDGTAHWLSKKGCKSALAPSFGFTGTHIMERPHGF